MHQVGIQRQIRRVKRKNLEPSRIKQLKKNKWRRKCQKLLKGRKGAGVNRKPSEESVIYLGTCYKLSVIDLTKSSTTLIKSSKKNNKGKGVKTQNKLQSTTLENCEGVVLDEKTEECDSTTPFLETNVAIIDYDIDNDNATIGILHSQYQYSPEFPSALDS